VGFLIWIESWTASPVNRGKLAKNRGESLVDLGNALRVLGLNLVGDCDEWATRNIK
jgi:hypothetical protein